MRCQQQIQPNMYEVIRAGSNACLYLDIERPQRLFLPPAVVPEFVGGMAGVDIEEFRSVNAAPWSAEQVAQAGTIIFEVVVALLQAAFRDADIVAGDVTILSSSAPKKLSFHVVVPKLQFDQNVTSCAAVAWEILNALEQRIESSLASLSSASEAEDVAQRATLLRLLNVNAQRPRHGSVVDMAVYSRNQCFRMIGNAKRGGLPLQAADPLRSHWPFVGDTELELFRRDWTFRSIVNTLAVFSGALVATRSADQVREQSTITRVIPVR